MGLSACDADPEKGAISTLMASIDALVKTKLPAGTNDTPTCLIILAGDADSLATYAVTVKSNALNSKRLSLDT